jgi:hypothetical protein
MNNTNFPTTTKKNFAEIADSKPAWMIYFFTGPSGQMVFPKSSFRICARPV